MRVHIEIPEDVAQAIRLPESRIKSELLTELAVGLYSQDILSFGKARELARMGKYEFGQLLGKRSIPRHYGTEELGEDMTYAGSE